MTILNEDRLIVECTCNNPDHLLIFDYYKDDYTYEHDPVFDEINVSFTSKYYDSFWKRLKIGLKYIFKGKTYMTGDCVCFNYCNIVELERLLDFLKERIKGI